MSWTIHAPADEPRLPFLERLRFDRLAMPEDVQALAYCTFMACRPRSVTVTADGATLVVTADPPLSELQRIKAGNGARGYVPAGIAWRFE